MVKKYAGLCLMLALLLCFPCAAQASGGQMQARSSGITPWAQIKALLFHKAEAEKEPEPAADPSAIDPDRPMIALTFDDGPGKATADILDILLENDARATFFVIGDLVEKKADLVQRAAEQGCEIGNHTWSHRNLTELTTEEIREQIALANDAVLQATGQSVAALRPPAGEYNDLVRSVAREMEVSIVMWSVDTKDWRSRDAQMVYDMIMAEAKDGSIIICHDLYASTAEAVARAVPELTGQGYQFVTVSELLSFRPGGMAAGEVYKKR